MDKEFEKFKNWSEAILTLALIPVIVQGIYLKQLEEKYKKMPRWKRFFYEIYYKFYDFYLEIQYQVERLWFLMKKK